MNQEEIENLIQKTLLWCQSDLKIQLKFNSRAFLWAGRARYNGNIIELSAKTFGIATQEQKTQTIIHETCHLIANSKFNHKRHGEPWKLLMKSCGYQKPLATHNIDVSQFKLQRKGAIRGWCLCKSHVITIKRYQASIKRKSSLTCLKCGQTICFMP